MANSAIPTSPAQVTADWLSSVLGGNGRSVTVSDVDITPVGTGQTGATYRVSTTYAYEYPDLPRHFVVKLPSQDDDVKQRVALGYRTECLFYMEVALSLRLPVPRCFHCEISDASDDFVLLMSDSSPATQGDQIAGCSLGEAELAVEALAALHGRTWCEPAWLEYSGVLMPKPDAASAKGLCDITRMATDITVERLGSVLSEEDLGTLDAAASVTADWLLLEPNRFCLLHGDYRIDNILFDPDRNHVTVVDWQNVAVGLPARDLSFFLATSLQPELRASSERSLVNSYYRALCAHGVTGYDRDTCWRDYRIGLLQVPVMTTMGLAFSATTARGDEMVLRMAQRGCQAIRDAGTLELVRTLSADRA